MSDDLERLLRVHDPTYGKTLTAADRTRTLAHARAGSAFPKRRLSLAFAVIALLIALVTMVRQPQPRPRQIQYVTPGGTRIVWTLDPNFHM
jgi:ferric-dicitrate binding protein FerR (iron transport regulator)